jgi:hypothetical protein
VAEGSLPKSLLKSCRVGERLGSISVRSEMSVKRKLKPSLLPAPLLGVFRYDLELGRPVELSSDGFWGS